MPFLQAQMQSPHALSAGTGVPFTFTVNVSVLIGECPEAQFPGQLIETLGFPQWVDEATKARVLANSSQHEFANYITGTLMDKKIKGDLLLSKLMQTQKGGGFHELECHQTWSHLFQLQD